MNSRLLLIVALLLLVLAGCAQQPQQPSQLNNTSVETPSVQPNFTTTQPELTAADVEEIENPDAESLEIEVPDEEV